MARFRIVWVGPDGDPERELPEIADPTHPSRPRYGLAGTEMVLRERLPNGRWKVTPIASFSARIVRDVICEDEIEGCREFGLEVDLQGRKVSQSVRASEFAGMGWVLRKLGPTAIIYPGQQQHARAAIQFLSGAVKQERVFTRLGWVKQGELWFYLQAEGGAIGAEGSGTDLQVQLPASLQHYYVMPPADPETRARAIRASLQFLSIAPDRIIVPLLAAVCRAPLGNADFSLFLAGRTGSFKTALTALCQQHFGARMDARRLPGNFASTANALEELAYRAQDTLLVIDDFVLPGGPGDSTLGAIAERLFRGAGNGQGRGRMRGGRLHAGRHPRALLLATGEDLPKGHSIRARLLIISVRSGDVNRAELGECQQRAQEGLFATAMGSYISWIARDYEGLQDRLRRRADELRASVFHQASAAHARLPGILAELQAGFEVWLEFAVEAGAIEQSEQVQLKQRCRKALEETAAVQGSYHRASDPAFQFLSLLRSALAAGQAHIADRHGMAPESADRWGWRPKPTGRGWLPQGSRIGWLAGGDVFLESGASYRAAQELAGSESLPISALTLHRRLRQRGLLAGVDAGRQMLLVRRVLEGCSREVLHIKQSDLAKL